MTSPTFARTRHHGQSGFGSVRTLMLGTGCCHVSLVATIGGVSFRRAFRAYLLQQGEKVYVGAMLLDCRPERCEIQRCGGRGR